MEWARSLRAGARRAAGRNAGKTANDCGEIMMVWIPAYAGMTVAA